MKTLTLDLPFTVRETLKIQCHGDGRFRVQYLGMDGFGSLYTWSGERTGWLIHPVFAPLVPAIDAAFEALKENADGLHRP